MRTSCIRLRANSRIAVLYEDLLEICDGNMLAAMLLSSLIYWTDTKIDKKDENMWIWKSHEGFQEDLMFDKPGMKPPHRTTISSALELLKTKEFIEWRKNPKVALDRTRQYLVHQEKIQVAIDKLPTLESRKSNIAMSENRLSTDAANKASSDDSTTDLPNVGKPTMQSRNNDNALSEKQHCNVGKPTSNTSDYLSVITNPVITKEGTFPREDHADSGSLHSPTPAHSPIATDTPTEDEHDNTTGHNLLSARSTSGHNDSGRDSHSQGTAGHPHRTTPTEPQVASERGDHSTQAASQRGGSEDTRPGSTPPVAPDSSGYEKDEETQKRPAVRVPAQQLSTSSAPESAKVERLAPAYPPADAEWKTTTCLQLFTYWRGKPLISKYQNQQASHCAKGLAANYTREQVEAVRAYMVEDDPWWSQRPEKVDVCSVAEHIHEKLGEMERAAAKKTRKQGNGQVTVPKDAGTVLWWDQQTGTQRMMTYAEADENGWEGGFGEFIQHTQYGRTATA